MVAQGLFHGSSPGSSGHGILQEKKKCLSGLPRPPPWDSPNPGIEPASLMSPTLTVRLFTTSATWEAGELRTKHGLSLFF